MASEQNKRLAKNTFLLYLRQLITIIISLYTSRVILQVLGVDDYGVFNVVGGVVGMIGFLNSAMTAASQRFISYELGTGNLEKLKKVFSASIAIHAVLSFIILIISESVGLWFLNTQMNIEPNRMFAANWVFQCAIITTLVSIVNVPYNAVLVAHERMDIFAYLSIANTIMKLLIVYLLLIYPRDKLITYAVLTLLVQVLFQLIYMIYCKYHFPECTGWYKPERHLFKEIFLFASWSIIGNLGFSFKDQASNIILNIFFGTVVNGARGIAVQVQGALYSFSTSFLMALNPQITKEYSSGNINGTVNMVYSGCRFSPFLMGILCIPLMTNMDYALELWLNNVPQYTGEFLQLTLICAMINCLAFPIVTALQATGKIKIFQIAISINMLCELPLAYVLLKMGYPPYAALYPMVLVTFIGIYVRFAILKKMIQAYSYWYFTLNIVFRDILVFILAYISSAFVIIHGRGFLIFILNSCISFLLTCMSVFFVGLKQKERNIVYVKIKSWFLKV